LPSIHEASLHDVVVFLLSSHTRRKCDPLAVVLLFCLILDSLQANYFRNRSSGEIAAPKWVPLLIIDTSLEIPVSNSDFFHYPVRFSKVSTYGSSALYALEM
jgi:hypothetical protein